MASVFLDPSRRLTVDVRFDRAGGFRVQCAIHPTMHLEVTVE